MFGFPSSTSTNPIKDSIDAQFSFFSAVSASIFNTSLQIHELNLQAVRKLIEESASEMQRALQIKSLPETGLFLVEQSRATIEKMHGYQQNIQNIVANNQLGLQKILDASVTDDSSSLKDESESTAGVDAGATTKRSGADAGTGAHTSEHVSADAGHARHEAEHRAPPLVEKLIASAVADTGKTDHKS